MKLLLIFGTAHSLQMGSVAKDTEKNRLFKAELEEICSNHRVSLIAEEMSNEALMRSEIPNTIGHVVANEQNIDHLLCDPSSETRSKLGIRDSQTIELDAILESWEEGRRDREIKRSWSLREDWILSRIQSAESDRVLLICGANHVQAFASKAKSVNMSVRIVYRDWEPNNGFNSDAGKARAG